MQRSRISWSPISRVLAPDLAAKSLMIFLGDRRGDGVYGSRRSRRSRRRSSGRGGPISHSTSRRVSPWDFSFTPADVQAGQVAHGEGAHGEAEVVEHPVHVPGHGALEDQLVGFALALAEDAVADEAG